jgi:hypothetical protein
LLGGVQGFGIEQWVLAASTLSPFETKIFGSGSADVHVLNKFRTRQYKIDNLHIIDDTHTFRIPNTDIRVLGLGVTSR